MQQRPTSGAQMVVALAFVGEIEGSASFEKHVQALHTGVNSVGGG